MVPRTSFNLCASTPYKFSRVIVYLMPVALVCWASPSSAGTTLEFSSFSAAGFTPTTDTPNKFVAEGSIRIRGTRDGSQPSSIDFDPISVLVNGTHWDFTLTFDATSFDYGANVVTGMNIAMTGVHNTAPHPDSPFDEQPSNILPQISALISGNIGTTSKTQASARGTDPHDDPGDRHRDAYAFGFTRRDRDGQPLAFMRTNRVSGDILDLEILNIRIEAVHPGAIVPVPAAAPMALLGMGLVGLFHRSRRNRNAVQATE